MKYFQLLLLLLIPAIVSGQASARHTKSPVNSDTVAMLKSRVTADPGNMDAHMKFIKYVGIDNPDLARQYEIWMSEYPKTVTVPYAIGEALYNAEYPTARPYLLKAVELDPKLAKVYLELSIDAERWGNFKAARDFMKRACEAEPQNPDYAFYYASSFSDSDPAMYKKLSLEVVDKFPATERGAQALYWLALRTKDIGEKIKLYNRSLTEFPPDKFNWSSGSMPSLFDAYLETDPAKASEFARQMQVVFNNERDKKSWTERELLAENVIKVKALLSADKATDAEATAQAIVAPKYSSLTEYINLLKAETSDVAGNTDAAYKGLLEYFSAEPTDKTYSDLLKYGKKLGKSEEIIRKDVHDILYSSAVPATPFSLVSYLTNEKVSLSDLRGNVVLLTYFFPGCGPCRGEFPNFENVIRKFKGKNVKYVGINIAPEQDEYVVPFVGSCGYSFTPLKDEPDKRGNLTAVGAPTNYLLDKEGNIIFRNFRTDDGNERTLELMIEFLLDWF